MGWGGLPVWREWPISTEKRESLCNTMDGPHMLVHVQDVTDVT
jgi:hypothetical protein